MKENVLLLDNQLCFSIYACSREMIKLYHPLLKELDITYPQYLVLLVLWEKETLSVKQLGKELYLDSGTLTPLLKRLEERGIVSRKRSMDDERIVHVQVTEKGLALKDKASEIPLNIFEGAGLPIEEYKDLNKKIRSLLGKLHQK
ncbi:MarR family winged helix-turn-helix transcriptional regulator [Metabacillus sp. RGM 3146]|uniref:MarR family winged helix-turn-helix transcriptional regulator n=1 Tax=Metabacillus sp. RGM 3146 TaxID=3401092 RepID=UPI003B9ACC07